MMIVLTCMGRWVYKARLRSLFAVYLASCFLLLYIPTATAKPYARHSLVDIEKSIKAFVKTQFSSRFKVDAIVNKFDPHLLLQQCPRPLDVFFPARAARMGPTTIWVQCLSNRPWKIHVSVQIKVFGPAVISKQSLPRGTILSAEDLSIARRDISSALHGYFKSIKEVEGMELQRSMGQGQVIGPKSVKPRHLVKRGDIVTVIAETNGLHIQIKGKALMNGYHGQSIRIKNTRTNRVLQGEVVAARTVRIKL